MTKYNFGRRGQDAILCLETQLWRIGSNNEGGFVVFFGGFFFDQAFQLPKFQDGKDNEIAMYFKACTTSDFW